MAFGKLHQRYYTYGRYILVGCMWITPAVRDQSLTMGGGGASKVFSLQIEGQISFSYAERGRGGGGVYNKF